MSGFLCCISRNAIPKWIHVYLSLDTRSVVGGLSLQKLSKPKIWGIVPSPGLVWITLYTRLSTVHHADATAVSCVWMVRQVGTIIAWLPGYDIETMAWISWLLKYQHFLCHLSSYVVSFTEKKKVKNFHHRLNNEPIESVRNRYDRHLLIVWTVDTLINCRPTTWPTARFTYGQDV